MFNPRGLALLLLGTLALAPARSATREPPSPSLPPPAAPAAPSTHASRFDAFLQQQRLAPIPAAWYKMKSGRDASDVLKWHLGPVAARLSLPTAERAEALALYLKALDLCDNSYNAPWSTTQSLAVTWMLRDSLPPEVLEAQKRLLSRWNYNCSAGTINMRLYLHVAGYLAAEQWPDFRDSPTPVNTTYAIDFRGRTVRSHDAAEIKVYCREKILEIFRDFTVRNLYEHDLVYLPCDLDAVRLLADFALDPDLRARAVMVMDYGLLQLATAWNQGRHVEPFYRQKYFSTMMGDRAPPTEYLGWLYFGGDTPGPFNGKAFGLIHGNPRGYRMPPVIAAIAHDRSAEREIRESHFDGDGAASSAISWKTLFHTPAYSLASAVNQYDGRHGLKTALFKEQRLLNLTWFSASDATRPDGRFYVFQENIAQPYFGKTKLNDFGQGENPYSQRMQHRRTALGLYDVPATYPFFRQFTVYRSADAPLGRREHEGWVFAHAGPMLFGFYSWKPTRWEKSRPEKSVSGGVDVRWCEERLNAWILETANASRYPCSPAAQLDAFAAEVLRGTRIDTAKLDQPVPELSYQSIHGDTLRLVFSTLGESVVGRHFVNGTPVDYPAWPTLGSPWAQQAFNSPIVTLRFDGTNRTYDFNRWTVVDANPVTGE